MENERLLSDIETAEYFVSLGVRAKKGTLQTWRDNDTGPKYHKLAGGVYYKVADIEEWIKSGVVTPKNNK